MRDERTTVTAEDRPVLTRLERDLGKLPEALARVAKYVLENPEKVVRQSLTELSGYAKSGQASAFRLCRELGYEGYSEFKLALTAELAVRERGAATASSPRAPLQRVAEEISTSVLETAHGIDAPALRTLMLRLRQADRIDLFGSGVSGIVAELLSYRLLRLGLNAHALRDPNLAHEIANGLGAQSAAIAVSESGVTADTVEFLQCAKSAGAFPIAKIWQEQRALLGSIMRGEIEPEAGLAKIVEITERLARE